MRTYAATTAHIRGHVRYTHPMAVPRPGDARMRKFTTTTYIGLLPGDLMSTPTPTPVLTAGSDLPSRGVDTSWMQELSTVLRMRANAALSIALRGTGATTATDGFDGLRLSEGVKLAPWRQPTAIQRRLHVGTHRSAQRRPVTDSMTTAAVIAFTVLASPLVGILGWFLATL